MPLFKRNTYESEFLWSCCVSVRCIFLDFNRNVLYGGTNPTTQKSQIMNSFLWELRWAYLKGLIQVFWFLGQKMGRNGQNRRFWPKILIFGPKMIRCFKPLLIIRNAPDLVYMHDFAQKIGLQGQIGHFWTFYLLKLISLFETFYVV